MAEVQNFILPSKTSGAMNKLKVLIVDDEPRARALLEMLIQNYCSEILFAKNGAEAVECSRKDPGIDLILMDKRMPEMDGYEATRNIRQFNKNVVIIALSASQDEEEKEKSVEAGSNYFLFKPVEVDLLIRLITQHFGK
jgi:CheY-like chemotaxis protein